MIIWPPSLGSGVSLLRRVHWCHDAKSKLAWINSFRLTIDVFFR